VQTSDLKTNLLPKTLIATFISENCKTQNHC